MFYNGKFKSLLLSFALIFILTIQVVAVETPAAEKILPRPTHEWRLDHLNQMFNSMQTQSGENPRVFQDVDVENYTMDFIFDLEASTLNAIVTIKGAALNSQLDEIIVDFYDDVPVNSIKFNGQDFTSFERKNNKVYMDISSSPIGANEDFTIIFDYTFTLGSSYNHGIVLRDQSFNPLLSNSEGESIYSVCSAGQPYFSSGWWPSFDYPSDKATYDIHITCPDNLIAVSNGSLQGEPLDNGDGTKTFYWKEKHRMYTSVFAVAISEYELFEDTYVSPLDNTEMPLFFYAFSPDAQKALGDGEGDFPFYTKAALQIFPVLFGEYPFIDEKYGVLESPFSRGSLEHQTITHLTYTATETSSNWDVVVHELGHQWWGDWVTCKDWHHVWLHEGFATYSEILFNELYTGESPGKFLSDNYDDGLYDGELAGTPYAEDLSNPWDENNVIYQKGGWVVHMLRYIMGDNDFFEGIKTFGQTYAYDVAETDDLRSVLEEVYGASLEEFFDQWIYTPYRPIYQYEFSANKTLNGKYIVDVLLYQTQEHMIKDISGNELRDYYIMPVDITVTLKNGEKETFTVYNNFRKQKFQFEVGDEPLAISLDKDIKILKKEIKVITDKGTNTLPVAVAFAFPHTVSAGSPVFLFGFGKDIDGSITSSKYIIDNKQIIDGGFNTIAFDEPGEHQIMLTVEDNQGDAGSSIPIKIIVN